MIKLTPLLDTLKLQKIDDESYFSNSYKEYISNSRLNLIDPERDGSPEKFFAGFKSTYNPSFNIGTYVHQLMLQGDLFELTSIDKPTAKMGILADKLYHIYKKRSVTTEDIINMAKNIDYYSGILNEKKIQNVLNSCESYWFKRKHFESTYNGGRQLIYTDPKTRQIVCNCVTALKSSTYIQELLHPLSFINNVISENEQAILLDIGVEIDGNDFILKFKAKLDNYTINDNVITVNDIKTIGKPVNEIYANIERFKYNREIAIYSWLLSLCANKYYGLMNPVIKGNYLTVSTIPNYYTKVVPMTRKMYNEGWNDFVYLIKLVAYYYNKGYRF